MLPPLSISRLSRLLLLASLVASIRTGVVLLTIQTFSGTTPNTSHFELAFEMVRLNGTPMLPRTLNPVDGGTGGVLPTNPPKPVWLLLQAASNVQSVAASDHSITLLTVR